MSNDIENMISSIVDGNKIEAETHFKNSVAQKISSALDIKRVEVANAFIQRPQETQPEDASADL
jgi:hypothetical protein|tara:strand:- start:1711 stop:1902 length:192 start_codon:yes stop_codon:yes gene_type:complete